jgi:hypothetical protein
VLSTGHTVAADCVLLCAGSACEFVLVFFVIIAFPCLRTTSSCPFTPAAAWLCVCVQHLILVFAALVMQLHCYINMSVIATDINTRVTPLITLSLTFTNSSCLPISTSRVQSCPKWICRRNTALQAHGAPRSPWCCLHWH